MPAMTAASPAGDCGGRPGATFAASSQLPADGFGDYADEPQREFRIHRERPIGKAWRSVTEKLPPPRPRGDAGLHPQSGQ